MRNIHVEYDSSNGYVFVKVEVPNSGVWPTTVASLTTEEAEHLRERLNLWHTQMKTAEREARAAELTEIVQLPDGPKAIITHLIEDHDIKPWSIPGSLLAQHEMHARLHGLGIGDHHNHFFEPDPLAFGPLPDPETIAPDGTTHGTYGGLR